MAEAIHALSNLERKTIFPNELEHFREELKRKGQSLVTVNGSFDLLHSGHLQLLLEAAMQGDVLLVALNTDASIRRYKSPDRPILSLSNRLQMIAALECVDYVTWFDEDDPCLLLSVLQPKVHVNGIEYGQECIEAETVRAYGGRIHVVERVPGLATSEIIKKIHSLCDSSALSTAPNTDNAFPST